jgi:hypothetical protein
VLVDAEGHRVSIVALPASSEDKEIRETRALSPRLTIDARQAAEVTFDARGLASGGDFKVTAGGVVYHVTVDRLTGRVRSLQE